MYFMARAILEYHIWDNCITLSFTGRTDGYNEQQYTVCA